MKREPSRAVRAGNRLLLVLLLLAILTGIVIHVTRPVTRDLDQAIHLTQSEQLTFPLPKSGGVIPISNAGLNQISINH